MSDIVVTKLGDYHCQVTWADREVFLIILDGPSAWSGQLDQHIFESIDTRTGARLGDSWDMAKEAFAGQSSKFAFTVENKKVIWRKVGGKAKIKLAEIELRSLSFVDAQNELLGHLIAQNNELKTKNKDFKRRQDNLVRDHKKSKSMLEAFEKEKNEIEGKMYERFLPILNSKKEKIRELERYGPRASHAVSEDDEEDYGSATDEDHDEPAGPNGKRSKLAMDDSLGLLNDSLI